MCHQSVGLIQSVIEKAGIATVSITLLREVTERVRPPRALFVDRPLGFPFGEPDNVGLQKAITMFALTMTMVRVDDLLLRELPDTVTTQHAGGLDR
jgi:D-proline reductase (dithiol) PrdB